MSEFIEYDEAIYNVSEIIRIDKLGNGHELIISMKNGAHEKLYFPDTEDRDKEFNNLSRALNATRVI